MILSVLMWGTPQGEQQLGQGGGGPGEGEAHCRGNVECDSGGQGPGLIPRLVSGGSGSPPASLPTLFYIQPPSLVGGG